MMKARESYDRVAREYAERIAGELRHKPFDREMLHRFAALLGEVPEGAGLPVLDIGCGPGHVTAFLREAGAPVTGVDLSPGMLEEARRLNPGLEFREADMRSLPWSDSSVAGIAAPYSVIHIQREGVTHVLREFRRVLVPGGIVYLTFHVGGEVRHSDEWWDRPVDLDFVFFETAEMDRYLRDAGFSHVETFERDPYPEVEVQTRRAYVFARG